MSLGKLVTHKKTMGIDCSTNSMAFAIMQNKDLIKYGEITFNGNTTFERLKDGAQKINALSDLFDGVEKIILEGAIYVQNKKTVILLAYALGAILSSLPLAEVVEISPMTWQNRIGNKALTKEEKDKVRRSNPDQKETWYKNEFRKFRKQRTMDIVNKHFNINVDNDNIADAIGILLSEQWV